MLDPGEGRRAPSTPISVPTDGRATEPGSVFALDILRERLHKKIQEARGQVDGDHVEWFFNLPCVPLPGQALGEAWSSFSGSHGC